MSERTSSKTPKYVHSINYYISLVELFVLEVGRSKFKTSISQKKKKWTLLDTIVINTDYSK